MRDKKEAGAACALALLLGLPAPGAAQTEPSEPALSEDEQRAIEESLKADQPPATSAPAATSTGASSSASAAVPDIALILDFALAAFSDDEPLETGDHDPSETGFNLQQLEMSLGSNVDPYFRLDANLVFSLEGVEVEEAYATTLSLPLDLQVRAGQFLTRFGRINPTHPHSWSFVDQPLVIGKFLGPDGSRGLGAETSWLSPLPWYVELVASATQPESEHEDVSAAEEEARGGIHDAGDLVYTLALKQFFPFGPDWSLSWGLSAQLGPSEAEHRTDIYGTDLYLRWRPTKSTDRTAVSLQAEALYRRRDESGEQLSDWGGYAQLVWDVDPEWQVGARYERVSGLDEDPEWPDVRQRTSVQATWLPSHFSRLRLQGEYDRPAWRDEPIWAGFLALEVVAGAHGAHTF
jgi:hypothetical protein